MVFHNAGLLVSVCHVGMTGSSVFRSSPIRCRVYGYWSYVQLTAGCGVTASSWLDSEPFFVLYADEFIAVSCSWSRCVQIFAAAGYFSLHCLNICTGFPSFHLSVIAGGAIVGYLIGTYEEKALGRYDALVAKFKERRAGFLAAGIVHAVCAAG